jgi:hypothetical protein
MGIDHIELLKNAINHFESIQNRYKKYGAYDSEPTSIFQEILLNYEDNIEIPETGEGWALYTNAMNCERVARKMYDATVEVIDRAKSCPPSQIEKMEKFIKKYCQDV